MLKVTEHGRGIENDSNESSRCGSMCVEIHTNTASGDRMFAFSVKENIPSHARRSLFFLLLRQHKLCCGGILLASTLHKQTRVHVSEGQLSLFLFSNYDNSLFS